MFMDTQGMEPETRPKTIAAQPGITPAAGVIATSPVIMPLTAPMMDGFL